MKKSVLFLIAVVMSCLFSSCDPAKSSIDKLEKLVTKVETKGDSFSQQQWDDTFVEFENLTYKMDEYDYDKLQLKQIGRLKARFYTAVAKYGIENVEGILGGLFYQAAGVVEEVAGTVTEAVESINTGELLEETEAFLDEEIEEIDEALSELESLFE